MLVKELLQSYVESGEARNTPRLSFGLESTESTLLLAFWEAPQYFCTQLMLNCIYYSSLFCLQLKETQEGKE